MISSGSEVLILLWFILLAVVWAIYIIQEGFIVGGSVIASRYIKKDEEKFRHINTTVGTHWDGIQVWLILAVGGTFAAFPLMYAAILSSLYIPFFLLLYTIIVRGLAIELIYKTDSERIRKYLKYAWPISSALLFIVIGIYTVTVFMGLPIEDGVMNDFFFSFIVIFKPASIVGGLMFLVYALVVGALFLMMNYGKKYFDKGIKYLRLGVVVYFLLLMLILLAFNNTAEVFIRPIYQEHTILWLFPLLAIFFAFCALFTILIKTVIPTFISMSLSMTMFVLGGYLSMVPYAVYSTVSPEEGILIVDAASGAMTLTVMLFAVLIFLPFVLLYQGYKYYRFWGDNGSE